MSLGWHLLARELDAWNALGRRATLWWRDDDACRDSAALQRLFRVAQDGGAPIAVAVIPATARQSLAGAVEHCHEATVVQHGYAHRNHAPAGARSAELGSHRLLDACLAELAQGRDTLRRLFGERFVPVLVPPWNRIAAEVVAAVPSVGLCGLSCFGPRATATPCPRILQANTHVDLIAWRRDRRFIGADAAIERVVAHLRARRAGDADAEEPTGILTHHLALEDAAFEFMEALCAEVGGHRAAAWLDVKRVFAAPATRVTSARSA